MAAADEEGKRGWQSQKTIIECNRYMLDNEKSTDVCFEVGPPGGATAKIRAHKYVLTSRSEVFEEMFSKTWRERDTEIRIEDIEKDVFKELLSFIYCESFDVSYKTAAYLMYAGLKYKLPKLVEQCGSCLEKSLDENNVCYILEQSLKFGDKELAKKCLDVIAWNSDHVLKGTELPTASYDVLESMLRMDELMSHELLIYESCIKWAKFQLKPTKPGEDPAEQKAAQPGEDTTELKAAEPGEDPQKVTQPGEEPQKATQPDEDPTEQKATEEGNQPTDTVENSIPDQQIREKLGDLLYKIRFPIMDLAEFATLAGKSEILSTFEKSLIYYYLVKKDNEDLLPFSVKTRQTWIDRLGTSTPGQWNLNAAAVQVDAVNFTTNKDVRLTGLGLYGGFNNIDYTVDIEILQGTVSLFKKEGVTVPFTGNADPVMKSLNMPIPITSGVAYTVVIYPVGNINMGYYGNPFVATCQSNNKLVNLTFSNVAVPGRTNRSTSVQGQIPRLYFLCT